MPASCPAGRAKVGTAGLRGACIRHEGARSLWVGLQNLIGTRPRKFQGSQAGLTKPEVCPGAVLCAAANVPDVAAVVLCAAVVICDAGAAKKCLVGRT